MSLSLFLISQSFSVVVGQEINNIKATIQEGVVILIYDLLTEHPLAECEVKFYFGNSDVQQELLTQGIGDIGFRIKGGLNKSVKVEDLNPFKPFQEDLAFSAIAIYTYLPITGNISITTEPLEAQVYINDKYVGLTDQLLTYQDIGKYRIKIKKEGFLTIEKEVEITKNKTVNISEKLTPGYLVSINSNPNGAKVFINKKEVGNAPLEVILENGENLVELFIPNFNSVVQKITPEIQNESYNFEFTEKLNQIVINTFPKSANINYEQKQHFSSDTITTIAGVKKIKISKEAYKTFEGTFKIEDLMGIKEYNYFLEPVKFHKKNSAIIGSLLFPGFGQRYLKRKGVEPLIGVIGYGLIVGSVLQHGKAVDTYDLYLDSSDAVERSGLKSEWTSQKKQSNELIYMAAGVWIINIIWTIMSPDENARYNRMKSEMNFDNVTKTRSISFKYQIGG